jgi:hypothetical protein
MKALTTNEDIDVDIDIEDISMRIDAILHRRISDHTLVTINHERIYGFIIDIINHNNSVIMRIREDNRQIAELVKKEEERFHDKVDSKKIVKHLHGISNKFKFYVLGYILINKK